MIRVFQPLINKQTQELTEPILRNLIDNPKYNELVKSYRELKRQMAEATASDTVDEAVKEIAATSDYKDWLDAELKKDERRRKKKLPETDLKCVQQYIAQKKSSLPAVIPTVTHFAENKDQWGKEGRWRVQKYGYLSGLAVLDADHVKDAELRVQEWLQREDFKELGILWIFITPSGEGIKVVFKARLEWGNLQDNAYQMAEKLGVLDYADSQTKNSDHAHFIPMASDVKYMDWKTFFTYENPDYEARYGEAYRNGDSDPTQPRWQEFERKRKEARKQMTTTDNSQQTSSTVQTVELTERDNAIVKALNEHYGENIAEGHRHETYLSETAPWLLLLTDNNAQKTLAMSRQLSYIKNWTDQTADELENCVSTVQKKPLLHHRPKALAELLEKAGIDKVQKTTVAEFAEDLPTSAWVEKIRGFFGVYPCMQEVCEWTQERLWPFLLFATSGLAGSLMTLCWWYSYDNPFKKRRLNYNILGVGDPAVGKGPLEDLCELWTEPIAQADKLVNDTMNEWKEQSRSRGANKDKAAKPKGVVRIHGARTSNNVFINDMMNAWAEVDGERMQMHLLTVDSEALNSIKMAKGGSWIDRSVMEIKAWSNEKDSQQYANLDSLTGSFNVCWNQVRTCTPLALQVLSNSKSFGSGWPLRVSAIPVPDNDFDMIPLHTRDEKSTEDSRRVILDWAYRLDRRQGELPIWPLVEHAWHWTNDQMAIAKFNEDKAQRMLLKRISQTTLCIAAPWVDMRHTEERERTGTYTIDETDIALFDLLLDIQYKTQRHFFYELARKYYDSQKNDETMYRHRSTRYEECFRRLQNEFTTEEFAKTFGYANPHSAQKTLERLIKDKCIERSMRGSYKKLISEL